MADGNAKAAGRLVYVNGEFVPEAEAGVSIFDSALMFGDMVFEMTRSFNKVQFKLEEHIERLYAGIKMLKIPVEMTPREMAEAVYSTIEVNGPAFSETDEHRIMIDVTRGPLSMYARVFDGVLGPKVIISDFPLKWTVAPLAPLYDSGVHAVIPSQRAIPAHLLEPKIKNRSRLHYLMANLEVALVDDPAAWALLLDPDGFPDRGYRGELLRGQGGQAADARAEERPSRDAPQVYDRAGPQAGRRGRRVQPQRLRCDHSRRGVLHLHSLHADAVRQGQRLRAR